MVRNYKPKKQKDLEKERKLTKACDKFLKDGSKISIAALAVEFGVSRMTLSDRISILSKGKAISKPGHPTELSIDEEKYLVQAIQYCGESCWPMGREAVIEIVKSFVSNTNRNTVFKEGRP